VIDVFVWCVRPGYWKAFAPTAGFATSASNRSETLRQLRRALADELDQWNRELRILDSPPEKRD
jgi:hypothetical protein